MVKIGVEQPTQKKQKPGKGAAAPAQELWQVADQARSTQLALEAVMSANIEDGLDIELEEDDDMIAYL